MTQLVRAALDAFPRRLKECFGAFPTEMRNWRPASWEGIPSEHLSAIEQLCHVRDVERDGYHIRIGRTLSEENPVLEDIPGEQLAIERSYSSANFKEVIDDFIVARAQTLDIVGALEGPQLRRVAIFEGRSTTLEGLLHFLCSHDNQHLAGLHWLLGSMQASTRET